MSLILEALRKSEAERRRGLAPDVAMELPPTPTSRPRAMATWLFPALIVATLLVLVAWWSRREPPTPVSMPQEPASEAAQPASASNPQTQVAMPRIEPRSAMVAIKPETEMPAVSTPPPAQAAPPTAATRVTPLQPAPVPTEPTAIPPAPAGDISNDTSQLPPAKLSMLMWDEVPSKRFVILNGQRMAEGDHYGAITVITIERSGVVLEGNGAKARVPLP